MTANVGDGGVFTLDDGTRRLRFEFDTDGSVAEGNIAVPLSSAPTVAEVIELLKSVIRLSGMQFTAVDLGSGNLQVDGSLISSIVAGTSGLQVTGKPGVRTALGLQIPLVAGQPVSLSLSASI